MIFLDKYQILANTKEIKIKIEEGEDFSDNDYELVEIALKMKYYDTFVLLYNRYYPDIMRIFQYGFSRQKELLLDNDVIIRKHPYVLIQLLSQDIKLKKIKKEINDYVYKGVINGKRI